MTSHRFRQIISTVFLATVGAVCSVHAAGFAIYEASTKGNVMGGAVVGKATDASTVYHNPANMTRLPGVNTMVGVTVIAPDGDVTFKDTGAKYSLHNSYFTPPHAYLTYQTTERWWLGAGIYTPFGLGTDYKRGWRGDYNNSGAKITTLEFNPNIAFQATDDLALALGGRVMYFDLALHKNGFLEMNPRLPPGAVRDSKMKLEGDSINYGWNAALDYDITDDLSFGLVYRSRVRHHVKGNASMSATGPYAKPLGLPAYSRASGYVTLPDSLSAGLNYQANERLNLGAVATYTHWSTYERLAIRFHDGLGPAGAQTRQEKDWDNVWRYGIGADYVLTGPWSVQAGYIYDQCPIKTENADFLLPAGNRNLFSLGVSFDKNDWTVQLGYTYLLVKTTHYLAPDTGAPVKFENGDAHILACSVGRKF